MQETVKYTEEELIHLLQNKSREGFDYLYKNYAGTLYGVIHKVIADEQTAQDVLQDVFVKIWKNISSFDSTKGRIYTWMLNVARNSAIDKLRSKGEIMKGKIQTGENVVYNLEQGMKTEQRTDTIGLNRLVDGLKPEYRTIINLSYYKGFTLDEISKTLDVPLGTIKTRMRHAMQLLRQNFSN